MLPIPMHISKDCTELEGQRDREKRILFFHAFFVVPDELFHALLSLFVLV